MTERFSPSSQERKEYLNYQGPINGYTKLIDASLRGRADVIKILIAAGADRTIKGHNGMMALEAARLYNSQSTMPLSAEIMELLQPSETETRSPRQTGL